MGTWTKYSYFWITLVLFLTSLIGHWTFAWFAFVDEQTAHQQEIIFDDYLVEVMRDTLENWQSEFLQLIWQVAGLAYLLYVGSPQSKEGDERKEEKLDYVLRAAYGEKGDEILQALEKKYPKK